jgi:dTDP-4-amino-4,6-dideoxygalactose transaminase
MDHIRPPCISNLKMILCSNPKAQYLAYKDEIDSAIKAALSKGQLILGENVYAFEKEFSEYIGSKYCIGVGNGTDALFLAMHAMGLGPGDEVIAPSHTATATIAAISMTGATPILVDVDPIYHTIDPFSVSQSITSKTKAVIVVHMYGQAADMDEIVSITRQNNLRLIEDCAQAPGATHKNRQVGNIGDVGCFSFYPTKNLGALGDAGAIVTSNQLLANKISMLREYGWDKKRISQYSGFNSRLDEIQAAVLRVKLKYLEKDNAKRIVLAKNYGEELNQLPLDSIPLRKQCKHIYHLYVIGVDQRDTLVTNLKSIGIIAGIHYPVPVHLMPAYKKSTKAGLSLDNTENISKRVLSLPIYPELTESDQNQVINNLKKFLKS